MYVFRVEESAQRSVFAEGVPGRGAQRAGAWLSRVQRLRGMVRTAWVDDV